MKLAVMDGPLYPHSSGLVLVSRPTKVHVLLLDQVGVCAVITRATHAPGIVCTTWAWFTCKAPRQNMPQPSSRQAGVEAAYSVQSGCAGGARLLEWC